MPELPEAETIVRTLAPRIVGHKILEARFLTARVSPTAVPDLVGRVVRRVGRYGKQVVFELDGGFLRIELRMTGLLLWRGAPGPYTRAWFRFAHGAISFDDIRQFGSVRWSESFPDDLGSDPREIGAAEFTQSVRARSRRLKPLLLDQRFLRGLGNICVDEILFRARLHPLTRASRISASRCYVLHEAMRRTLEDSIAAGGSSVSDYVDADGKPGRFQLQHQVYRKAGRPCPQCGARIRRIVVGQRGTCYCPHCQRQRS